MAPTQEEKILSGLSHIAAIITWIGLAYLVAIYIIYRPKSSFVAAHAKQGLGLWIASSLASLVVGLILAPIFGLGMLGGMAGMMGGRPGGMIGLGFAGLVVALIFIGLTLLVLVVAIIAAIRAFNGQEYRYPIIGDFVARVGE